MTTRQKRSFNFDKTLILECSVECFTQVKTPWWRRSPYQDIRGPNITEFLLPSFPAFRPKSSGILYFLSRFVQIPYYSHCKYFVILCTSFFIHGQNLESEKSLSRRSHWVQTPKRDSICMLCVPIVIIHCGIICRIIQNIYFTFN